MRRIVAKTPRLMAVRAYVRGWAVCPFFGKVAEKRHGDRASPVPMSFFRFSIPHIFSVVKGQRMGKLVYQNGWSVSCPGVQSVRPFQYTGLMPLLAAIILLALNPNAHSCEWALKEKQISWRRPTLPGSDPPSTIGAVRLNDRVRDGTGCTPDAQTTKRLRFPCGSAQRRVTRQLLP